MFKTIIKKLGTLRKLNWRWAWRFSKKRGLMYARWYASRLRGRMFWTVTVDGVSCKLGFSYPYHHLFARNVARGQQERMPLSLWKHYTENAPAGALFVDFGGYDGVYGLIAAKSNPSAHVIICEPDMVNVRQIEKNITLNECTNITILKAALSDHSGTVSFKTDAGGTAGHVDSTHGPGTEIKSVTIGEVIASRSEKPWLIKLDVVGAEKKALFAAHEVLVKAQELKILLEFYPETKEENARFWKYIGELGYRSTFLYPRSDGQSEYYFLFK